MPEVKDEIVKQAQKTHLVTIGFLMALKNNCDFETSFNIAVEGFTNYMKMHYTEILKSTKEGSQERFNMFRNYYQKYAQKIPYIHIVESTPTTLKVRFDRCPFVEVLEMHNLSDFAYAFCLSDPAFTAEILPGVVFHREHVIAQGDAFCDHTWTYSPG